MKECQFRWAGQYFDCETNLCYNRYRYYSPETGSYLSQDLIRLHSGEPNLYAYVHDTNSWIDILGLSGCKPSATSLSDKDFVQRIADKAERWGKKNGKGAAGTGPAQGSSKHADALMKRYQRMTGQKTHLETEQAYLSGNKVPRNTAGSARPDVYNSQTGEIFDYKFTKNSSSPISNKQQTHNSKHLPKVTSQTAIHP